MRGTIALFSAMALTVGAGMEAHSAGFEVVWSNPIPIDTGGETNAHDPRIVFDQDGRAIVVFRQSDGEWGRIYANRYNGSSWNDAAWAGAVQVDADTGVLAFGPPKIAVAPDGTAIALFIEGDETLLHIYANRYNGSEWGSAAWDGAVQIDAESGLTAIGDHQISFDGGGTAMAVFTEAVSTGPDETPMTNIYANHYNGSTWGPAAWDGVEEIDSSLYLYAGLPRITYDGSGTAIAVFIQAQALTVSANIIANRYKDSAWDVAIPIEMGAVSLAAQPEVAFTPNGDAIAVFTRIQGDGTDAHIYANYYDHTSLLWLFSWQSTADLIPLDTGQAVVASGPQIAFDAAGNAIVVFVESDGEHTHVYANRYHGTSTWGEGAWGGAVRIDAGTEHSVRAPRIAFAPDGTAIALFSQGDGVNTHIYANRYNGSEWGADAWDGAQRIDSRGGGDASQARIAFDENGYAIAVFRQWDGEHYRIYASRYPSYIVRINFQPVESEVPPDYLADYGGVYGSDGKYGWVDGREFGARSAGVIR